MVYTLNTDLTPPTTPNCKGEKINDESVSVLYQHCIRQCFRLWQPSCRRLHSMLAWATFALHSSSIALLTQQKSAVWSSTSWHNSAANHAVTTQNQCISRSSSPGYVYVMFPYNNVSSTCTYTIIHSVIMGVQSYDVCVPQHCHFHRADKLSPLSDPQRQTPVEWTQLLEPTCMIHMYCTHAV